MARGARVIYVYLYHPNLRQRSRSKLKTTHTPAKQLPSTQLSPSLPLTPPTLVKMATAEEIRAQSYVGFDSITQQIEHKLLKRGFQFNVIVVGEQLFLYVFWL